jgi:hypothetical protein
LIAAGNDGYAQPISAAVLRIVVVVLLMGVAAALIPTAAQDDGVIFSDDFSNSNSGWRWVDAQTTSWYSEYQNGQFHAEITGDFSWGYIQLHSGDGAWSFSDYSVEVDVIPVYGRIRGHRVPRRPMSFMRFTFGLRPVNTNWCAPIRPIGLPGRC